MPFRKGDAEKKDFLRSGDAVAEVLDFVTIIGILVISLGLIGLAGYPALRNAQETRYIENTKLSFNIMADSINSIAIGQSPSQNIEVKLYGGTLMVSGKSTIKLNGTNSSNKEVIMADQSMGSLENRVGDTVIAYEGTGVWTKYPNGKIFVTHKPLFNNQSNVIVIPVVKMVGTASTSGVGLSTVTAEGEPYVDIFTNMRNVTITIKGDYVEGWKDYLENMNDLDWVTGTGYTARLNTTRPVDVYVLRTEMSVMIR